MKKSKVTTIAVSTLAAATLAAQQLAPTIALADTADTADATSALTTTDNPNANSISESKADADAVSANSAQRDKDLAKSEVSNIAALGSSLSDAEKSATLATLLKAAGEPSQYQQIPISGDSLVKYLDPSQQTFNNASPVYSSALIKSNDTNTGIDVQIVPFNGQKTITTITEDQYKNVALTAGVTNATIYVTSPRPIDGSGALAGVYASLAAQGHNLNADRVSTAQDEMKTLSNITEANKGKDGYSDAQLNNAVAGAKSDLANKNGDQTRDQITVIVNNNLTKNGLDNVMTSGQKEQIVSTLARIQDSGALNDKNFKQQANKVADNIKSDAKNVFDKLNTKENRNFIQKIWHAVVGFFQGLFKG